MARPSAAAWAATAARGLWRRADAHRRTGFAASGRAVLQAREARSPRRSGSGPGFRQDRFPSRRRADFASPKDAETGSPPGRRSRSGRSCGWRNVCVILPDIAADVAKPLFQGGCSPAMQRNISGLAAAGRAEQPSDAAGGRFKSRIERKTSKHSAKARRDACGLRHSPMRAARFWISVIARMTAKENTTMPAARMFASRHCEVST